MASDGVYIVEDVPNLDLGKWAEVIESKLIHNHPHLVFRLISIPNLKNALDNNLVVVYSQRK